MATQEKLIAAMHAAWPNDSQAALARRAGLKVQRFNNYVQGIRTMDADAVIGCAQALGWDIRATLASHEVETSESPRVKAFFRKLAATATLLAVVVLPALSVPAQAATGAVKAASSYTLCEIRWWGRCLGLWLRVRFGKPVGPCIEAKSW